MRSHRAERPLALLLTTALLTTSSGALADDHAKAAELFDKGRALVKADKHAEACPLFEQALALEAGLGTELNLAICWAKIGRLLDARKLFQTILRKTKDPEQAQRHQIATDALLDIQNRLPKIQIERGALPDSATIRVDGHEVADPSEPVEVDPGTHVVDADGATTQTVVAVEGQVAEVVLVAGASEEPVGPRAGGDGPGLFGGDRRPLYVAGAGAALLVAGTITGVMTLSRKSDGLALCGGSDDAPTCGADGKAKLDSARTLSHVTTGLFVVGAGLVITGVIWKLRGKPTPDRPQVTGWVSGAGGGFALERTW